MQMFEESTYQGGPPIVAKVRPVPLHAKLKMKQLTAAAAARLGELIPAGTTIDVEMADHFVDGSDEYETTGR